MIKRLWLRLRYGIRTTVAPVGFDMRTGQVVSRDQGVISEITTAHLGGRGKWNALDPPHPEITGIPEDLLPEGYRDNLT